MTSKRYLPVPYLSLYTVFAFFVKISPPSTKSGFDDRIRLEHILINMKTVKRALVDICFPTKH